MCLTNRCLYATSINHINEIHLFLLHSPWLSPLLFFILNFIHLFLAALSLHCCAGLSLAVASRGLLFVAVCRLLLVVASLVTEHGLKGTWAQQLWPMGSVALWHVCSSWTGN